MHVNNAAESAISKRPRIAQKVDLHNAQSARLMTFESVEIFVCANNIAAKLREKDCVPTCATGNI
jgi:hypothetical protein